MQVHRDAFSYGQTPPGIDQRLVLDLRFFSPVEPEYHNWVEFTNEYCDAYGMPQPTFHFKLGEKDVELADQMMDEYLQPPPLCRAQGGALTVG